MEGLEMEALLFDLRRMPIHGEEPFHVEMLDWVRSVGVDPERVMPFGAIIRDADGWHMHLVQKLRNADNREYIDARRDLIATEPVDIPLGPEPCWPLWLGQVVEVTDMPGAHVVEVLHHAKALALNLRLRLKQEVART